MDSLINKPKICHIGGAHSVHVSDIVTELDKLDYEQCIISYMPINKSITPKHIPVYFYPYRSYNQKTWNNDKLIKFLERIYAKERPNIIHGHSLAYSCVAVWLSKVHFQLKTCITPWSVHTVIRPTRHSKHYETLCTGSIDYFLHGIPESFKKFQEFYGNIPDEKYILFRTLINLSYFQDKREITSQPKILAIRPMNIFYRQDLLIRALPKLVKRFPDLKVTLLIGQRPSAGRQYFNKIKSLAHKLKVHSYCTFIPVKLNQQKFAQLIKDHNIIYAPATHDSGFSGATLQAVYSGAITIVQDVSTNENVIIHGENVLKTKINKNEIENILNYAIINLISLQEKFIENNQKYGIYDKQEMMKNLLNCYQKMA